MITPLMSSCLNSRWFFRALRAGHEDVPVFALRLDSLRELQYVTQAFVFNDRALSISVSRSYCLSDFGRRIQPVSAIVCWNRSAGVS
ncbi:hypothetical protein PQR64_22480 [Paraburkholderia phytofirmans]